MLHIRAGKAAGAREDDGWNVRSARARGWYWLIAVVVAGCGGVASTATPTPAPACVGRALTPTRNVQAAIDRTPVMGSGTELIFVEGNSTDDTWPTIQAAWAATRR